jgi:hypothetical protein
MIITYSYFRIFSFASRFSFLLCSRGSQMSSLVLRRGGKGSHYSSTQVPSCSFIYLHFCNSTLVFSATTCLLSWDAPVSLRLDRSDQATLPPLRHNVVINEHTLYDVLVNGNRPFLHQHRYRHCRYFWLGHRQVDIDIFDNTTRLFTDELCNSPTSRSHFSHHR